MWAFGILGLKGDVLIFRSFREGISRNDLVAFASKLSAARPADEVPVISVNGSQFLYITISDVVLACATRNDANATLLFKWIQRFAELLRSYMKGKLSEAEVRKNFALIYEILDEAVDFGHIQIMEPDILKRYISKSPSTLPPDEEQLKRLTIAATGATSWRPEGIKYKQNQVFLDVIEKVNALVSSNGALLKADVLGEIRLNSKLSGMPECKIGVNGRLADVRYHQCVRLSRADEAVTFVPPDGEFSLMTYRVTESVVCPFAVAVQLYSKGPRRYEVIIRIRAMYVSEIFATDVSLTLPMDGTLFVSGDSKCKMVGKGLVWKINKIPGDSEETLRADIETLTDAAFTGRVVSLGFTIPMFTSSGLRVRYLKISEKSGADYQVAKWIRYVTEGGVYEHRL